MRRAAAYAIDLFGVALIYVGAWLSYRPARRLRGLRGRA